MDKTQIKLLRKAYREFLRSDEPIFEFNVGSDVRTRNRVPFSVLFPGLSRASYYLRHIISRLAQAIDYSPVKVLLYRMIGFRIGKGVFISPGVILDPQFPRLLDIGEYTVLGWGAKIFLHDYNGIVYRAGRVRIGPGCVVGGFSFIRAGVSIPGNTLVKLGSNVFNDKNPNLADLNQIREVIDNKRQEKS